MGHSQYVEGLPVALNVDDPTRLLSSHGVWLSHHIHHLNDVQYYSTTYPYYSAAKPILLVFINGLMLPQSMWAPTLDLLRSSLMAFPVMVPVYALTYDRYGQGESVLKDKPYWKPERHDMPSAAEELQTYLARVLGCHFPGPSPKTIIISHSIGVPLVRFWNLVTYAHLFLDSNIANTDFVSLLPDPDAESFEASTLPDDATVEDLRAMRERLRGMFHPSVPNSEGLDRRNLARLLPKADEPKLLGRDGRSPFLTVVGHDLDAFANEGLTLTKTPKGLNERYVQPAWNTYNVGLLKLGDPERAKGVVIAKGAGHFIQRDNPQHVAHEIVDLIEKVVKDG